MRRLLRFGWVLLGFLLVSVPSVAVIYNFFPENALAGIVRLYALRSGVTLKYAEIDGYTVPYYKGGNGPPIVLLHGFGDSKIAFVQVAQFLTSDYTLYLPDLPGFGDTLHDQDRDYSIATQVQFLDKFATEMGLTDFDLVGNSMGGHISAAYALTFPDRVKKLTLLNAAGLRVNDPHPYHDEPKAMETEEDYDKFMAKAFVVRPWVPAPFKRTFIEQAVKNFPWTNKIRHDIRSGPDYILNDRISKINKPTLILWGDGDKIVEVAHADIWHKGIKGSRLEIWKGCGHGPQYERPEATGKLIQEFLKQ